MDNQQDALVHADINVSEHQTRAMVDTHAIRVVPSYRLVDPKSQEVLYAQTGGSPERDKILQAIATWRQGDS